MGCICSSFIVPEDWNVYGAYKPFELDRDLIVCATRLFNHDS